MAKEAYPGPPEALAQYRAAVGAAGFECKGAKMPYTSMNGHMFSFLDEAGVLGLRLSPTDRESFLAELDASSMVQHGSVMKEYVAAPSALLADTAALARWFDASHAWVSSLKPKATARPKKG